MLARRDRPYVVKLVSNFLIVATLWLLLFLFEKLTKLLPLTDYAAAFIRHIHGASLIAAALIFAWLSVNDIIQVRKDQRRRQES